MATFSIKEDLMDRSVLQCVEIICISGPASGSLMLRLYDGDVKSVEAELSAKLGQPISISEEDRQHLLKAGAGSLKWELKWR